MNELNLTESQRVILLDALAYSVVSLQSMGLQERAKERYEIWKKVNGLLTSFTSSEMCIMSCVVLEQVGLYEEKGMLANASCNKEIADIINDSWVYIG